MAATGYTPIQLYYSTTAAATPSSGNLLSGELALNIQDEKLYFKNASGTVKVLASTAATAGLTVGTTTITSGTSGYILYNNAGVLGNLANTGTGNNVLATSPTMTSPTFATSILGDFTNATLTSRTNFVTSTANSATGIYALPSGTGTAASWQASNANDPTNASKILIATNGSTDVQLVSGINGTGTYLPLSLWNGGAGRFVIGTSGQFGIGPTASVSYGTAGQVLTSGGASAAPTWTTPSSGLTVGSTTITSGTNGYILYNNSGTLGNLATTGSGSVTLATAPTFTTTIDGGATFGAFGSSTALTLGYTGTGASSTTNISTAALTGAFTKTINIGTSGTTGSTTSINIGTSVGSTTTITGTVSLGTALPVSSGGTGSTTLTANSVMLGNGTSALSSNMVAPSTAGNVLTSNGTTWVSQAAGGGGGLGGMQVFSSPGTFTVPTGKTVLEVTVWGAGGGGGAANANSTAGGGGGAGGFAKGYVTVTPGASITVTIGSGGAAASSGGTTSFGPYISITGGGGGSSNQYGSSGGGNGGVATGGTWQYNGNKGSNTYYYSPCGNAIIIGGAGGDRVTQNSNAFSWGVSGAAAGADTGNNSGGAGGNGGGYGGGGGGGARGGGSPTGTNGGSGAGGYIIVQY
jgi:hypothetical protein